MSARSGLGFDTHRLVTGRPLIIGGVTIEYDRGLEGHSDADVLSHAVTDALLGAAALGDLGTHFPDTDAKWAGADSLDLLRASVKLVTDAGFTIGNIDATVICEEPKLAGHRDKMRANLAAAMSVAVADVNVKFTRGEGMGYVGRGEGIAVMAIASIQ
ncbi:MAG TPA: 2-C-methyl-D-erythritol 2,4-cyclodiphosphate synthase [Solirubrobacterales bacterium]|jgi:2-C-methyl-D-erythritol 2,4-cyclodiphosphate synthase|nr:2-C-methyl-D-erythritol 2,4-cyclodiphosphate synthase [Solirubrobacterales bacterium]